MTNVWMMEPHHSSQEQFSCLCQCHYRSMCVMMTMNISLLCLQNDSITHFMEYYMILQEVNTLHKNNQAR